MGLYLNKVRTEPGKGLIVTDRDGIIRSLTSKAGADFLFDDTQGIANYIVEDKVLINNIANSATAMNIVANSATARNTIRNSDIAWNIVANNGMAIGKFVAGAAGLNPADYADIDAVANSETARNAIRNSAVAREIVANNSMAIGKFVAGEAGLNPADYADMDAIANSDSAMDAILRSPLARNAMWQSPSARDAFWRSTIAVNAFLDFLLSGNMKTYAYRSIAISVPYSIVNVYEGKAHICRSTSTGHEWWDYPNFSTQLFTLNQTWYEHFADACPDLNLWVAVAYGDGQTQYFLNPDLSINSTWGANEAHHWATKTAIFKYNVVRKGSGIFPPDLSVYGTYVNVFTVDKILNYVIYISTNAGNYTDSNLIVWDVTNGVEVAVHNLNKDLSTLRKYISPFNYSSAAYYYPYIGTVYDTILNEFGYTWNDADGIFIF